MKKLFSIVFAIQLIVNSIVIFYVILIKQIDFLYIAFFIIAGIQTALVIIISFIANSKNPIIQFIHHKYLILDSKDMPKKGDCESGN